MDSAVENGEDNDCLLANDVKKAGRRERYTRACNQVENCFCRVSARLIMSRGLHSDSVGNTDILLICADQGRTRLLAE
jgi:hypothetical protein